MFLVRARVCPPACVQEPAMPRLLYRIVCLLCSMPARGPVLLCCRFHFVIPGGLWPATHHGNVHFSGAGPTHLREHATGAACRAHIQHMAAELRRLITSYEQGEVPAIHGSRLKNSIGATSTSQVTPYLGRSRGADRALRRSIKGRPESTAFRKFAQPSNSASRLLPALLGFRAG